MKPKKPDEHKVLERFIPVPESGCWLWLGSETKDGYGRLWINGKYERAHRISYKLFIGPIPDGMHLDHLCRVHCCINPLHLEAVTCRENLMRGVGVAALYSRKTHCVNGHKFDGMNTRVARRGTRHCRKCDKERHEKRRRARQV